MDCFLAAASARDAGDHDDDPACAEDLGGVWRLFGVRVLGCLFFGGTMAATSILRFCCCFGGWWFAAFWGADYEPRNPQTSGNWATSFEFHNVSVTNVPFQIV